MTRTVAATVLTPGTASAASISLSEALSFWGGYDPVTGKIIDQHHSQVNTCLKGLIVLLPGTRGSAGTPACIAEAIRLCTAPAGFILATPDINIATGALIAKSLYGAECPVVCVTPHDYEDLTQTTRLSIANDGTITLEEN